MADQDIERWNRIHTVDNYYDPWGVPSLVSIRWVWSPVSTLARMHARPAPRSGQ